MLDWIRARGEDLGVITLGTDRTSQGAAEVLVRSQPLDHVSEVVPRLPPEFAARPRVVVYAIDAAHDRLAAAFVLRGVRGYTPAHEAGWVHAQLVQIVDDERCGRADDVATETDRGGALERAQVGGDDILDVGAPASSAYIGASYL